MSIRILIFLILTHTSLAYTAEPKGKPWNCHIIDNQSQGADGVKLGDINNDGRLDITTGWEEGGITRVYIHPGYSNVKNLWPAVTVGQTPSVEDAVFADLDGDGSLDVISSCEGKSKRMFIQWGPKNPNDLLKPEAWKQELLPASKQLSQFWMYAWPMNVDGQHGPDIIAGSKGRNHCELGWYQAPKNARQLDQFKWHPISKAGWIMSIWKKDMDGDNDLDLVISDRKGKLRGCRWLENPGHGPQQKGLWKNHFMGARHKEVMSMHLGDLDGDGLEDAVVAVKDMKVLFLKRLDASGKQWKTVEISADYQAGNTRAVVIADVNRDKKNDLVITTWNARKRHGAFWLEYKNTPTESMWQAHQISGKKRGVKYDRIEMLDIDGDGDLDVLTCEEMEKKHGMGVFWYENPSP